MGRVVIPTIVWKLTHSQASRL